MSTPPPAGLCGTCRHGRVVTSGKGSTFLLCRRSKKDPRYPRYPRLPVLECAGWEARKEEAEASSGGQS